MESPSGTEPSPSHPTIPPQLREADAQAPDGADVGANPLLEQARAGDRRAMETLLAEARPRALAVALKVLRNPDDAEDAVQDAFLKVWRYLFRFEGRASFSTWLHRIVMNASLDLLRRQACRPEATSADDEPEASGRGPEPAYELTPERHLGEAETGALVRSALEALSPSHRQAITLREFEDRSYQEIARASRCPVGTVMSRLHHARRKLADELRATLADDAAVLCAA
jgi:RNA polymerase sigma-70 factor (ECF subfamily)